jgi:hypothetical protein
MADVYDAHRSAFNAVSAYVILRNGERVATVAIKHANAVTAFVHWIGYQMAKGRAGGGGYDRASASVSAAAAKMYSQPAETDHEMAGTFAAALIGDDGRDWTRKLEAVGFTVLQAV